MNTHTQTAPGLQLMVVAWANADLEIVASDEVKRQMLRSDPGDQQAAHRMEVPLYAICDRNGNPLFNKAPPNTVTELLASLQWALDAMAARNPVWTEGDNYIAARAAIARATA